MTSATKLYKVYEKIEGKLWREVDQRKAPSAANAITNTRINMIRNGNSAPAGTKYKAKEVN